MKFSNAQLRQIKDAVSIDRVIAQHVELKQDGRQLVGKCPFHDDDTPSFWVNPHKDGGVYLCRACGEKGDVFTFVQKTEGVAFPIAVRKVAELGDVRLDDRPQLVATYEYQDELGELLYLIERWEPGKNGRSKTFVQKKKGARGEWVHGKADHQVLYRLPEVARAVDKGELVFVVEGEKCADALANKGLTATTHAGGTGSSEKTWTKDFAKPLKGARVAIIPDNDAPGEKHALHVADVLEGVAADIRILKLGLKAKGADAVDFLKDNPVEELERLAKDARPHDADAEAWRKRVSYSKSGEPRGSVGNVLLILEHEAAMQGVLTFDELGQSTCIEKRPPWKSQGPYPRAATDDDALRAAHWLEEDYGISCNVDLVGRALGTVAREHPVNHLTDWLKGLKHDGQKRIDTWLADYFGAEDTELNRAIGAAWLISAVARAMKPGCQADHVLVLEGEQGRRKSSALAALAGDRDLFADEIPDMGSKDAAISVGKAWIIELGELDALKKSEVTRVKAFVTRRVDKYRPPYGRHQIEVPRRCVFAASTNDATYLRDVTGNRRFWPVRTRQRADVAGIERAREQLWAEAVARYAAGEPWWFTDSKIEDDARVQQEARLESDPWEDVLSAWAETQPYLTTADAFAELGIDKGKRTRQDSMRLSHVFRRLGFTERKQARGPKGREYRYLREHPPHEVSPPPGGGDSRMTPGEDGFSQGNRTDTSVSPPSPPKEGQKNPYGDEPVFPLEMFKTGSDGSDGSDTPVIAKEKRHHLQNPQVVTGGDTDQTSVWDEADEEEFGGVP